MYAGILLTITLQTKIMKKIIIFLTLFQIWSFAHSQFGCPVRDHKLLGTFVTTGINSGHPTDKIDYTEEDFCDYDLY